MSITYKFTPIKLQNGKTSLLEEIDNVYFPDDLWNHIKSFLPRPVSKTATIIKALFKLRRKHMIRSYNQYKKHSEDKYLFDRENWLENMPWELKHLYFNPDYYLPMSWKVKYMFYGYRKIVNGEETFIKYSKKFELVDKQNYFDFSVR